MNMPEDLEQLPGSCRQSESGRAAWSRRLSHRGCNLGVEPHLWEATMDPSIWDLKILQGLGARTGAEA